jgi:general secretion pathway protein F
VPLFHYKAASADGRVLEGDMEAASREALIRQLQSQGHVPIRAEVRDAVAAPARQRRGGRRVSQTDVMVFTTELGTLLQAGLPLDRALELLNGAASDMGMWEVLESLHRRVRGGSDLSSALREHPRLFSGFYVNMVRAGEAGGALDVAVVRLAEFLENARAVRDAVVSALIYPAILLVVAMLSLAVILGVVVPRVSQMFADAGERLPWYTELVVAAGNGVASYWWLILLAGIAVTAAVQLDYRSEDGRRRWDRFVLQLPVFGPLARKVEAARFCRSLGAMLGNGVPLLDAVGIARAIVSNTVIADGVQQVAGSVRGGEGLAGPLLREAVLPEMAAKLIHVGEESGHLEQMLSKVAEIYERDVSKDLNRMVSVLAPALVLGLAAVIFVIMVTLIVPIITLNRLGF